MTRVMVIAAHPDDEVLGCGGTLARFAAHGDCVRVVFATDGERGRSGATEADVERRRSAAEAASAILGIRAPIFLNFADQTLCGADLGELVRAIEEIGRDLRPELVLTHSRLDVNLDHEIVSRASAIAFRPATSISCSALLTYEVLSSTEIGSLHGARAFKPNTFVNIESFLSPKQKALECYASEMRSFPHPRSYEAVEALSRWRGATVGLRSAEAFESNFAILDNLSSFAPVLSRA